MPCSHGYKSPREMVEAQVKQGDPHGYPSTIMWFGRTVEEILKALEFWDSAHSEGSIAIMDKKIICPCCNCPDGRHYGHCVVFAKEQSKITREKAFKKIEEFWSSDRNKALVNSLEALGLLKFEEKVDMQEILVGQKIVIAYQAIEALKKLGYKIVRE